MPNSHPGAFMLSLIELEREDERPLYWQIYDSVRVAVLGRRWRPGSAFLPGASWRDGWVFQGRRELFTPILNLTCLTKSMATGQKESDGTPAGSGSRAAR